MCSVSEGSCSLPCGSKTELRSSDTFTWAAVFQPITNLLSLASLWTGTVTMSSTVVPIYWHKNVKWISPGHINNRIHNPRGPQFLLTVLTNAPLPTKMFGSHWLRSSSKQRVERVKQQQFYDYILNDFTEAQALHSLSEVQGTLKVLSTKLRVSSGTRY